LFRQRACPARSPSRERIDRLCSNSERASSIESWSREIKPSVFRQAAMPGSSSSSRKIVMHLS
jgi:hypothetical protein